MYLTDHPNSSITAHVHTALPSHSKHESGRPPQSTHYQVPTLFVSTAPWGNWGPAVSQTPSAKPASGYGQQNYHRTLGSKVRQPHKESSLGAQRVSTKLQLPHQNIPNYSVLLIFRLQRKREPVLPECRCSSTSLLSWEDTEGVRALTPHIPQAAPTPRWLFPLFQKTSLLSQSTSTKRQPDAQQKKISL